MKKLARILRYSCACFLLLSGVADAGAIDKLHRFLQTEKTLRANFDQLVRAPNERVPQLSSGIVMISRPGKFRWEIKNPYAQLLVCDGKKVSIYDADLLQVTIKKLDATMDSTPVALLIGGDSSLEKHFRLRELGVRDGLDWVEATPKKSDSGFEKLELGLTDQGLKEMIFFDSFGQKITIIFSAIEHNPKLSPSLFRFVPPEGVDVIGE